ncbi:MAG: hydrolase [Rickettsiales bacterium]
MDSTIQTQLDWIDSQQQHMVFLTESWSKINSGSYNVSGLRAMRAALADNFLWLGGEQEVLSCGPMMRIDTQGHEAQVELAECLSIRKRPDAPIQLLLVGHMDTVYGPEHPFQTPRFLSENVLNGPGVADLKGGLVVMLKALEALEKHPNAERVGWQVLLNPDEEIGSIGSDGLLKTAAKGKHVGLIYEPCMADGSLAGERKGSGNFSIVVRGRAAHAGRNPEDGRNAIVAAAALTQAIFALNGARDGVTFNPARMDGGGALNVVPDLAILHYNVRTKSSEDEAWATDAVAQICLDIEEQFEVRVVPHGFFTRSPKPMSGENQKIFDLVQQCGRELGMTIGIKPSGGCCDGNNLWKHGLANVDTLGVRGENIHSAQEIVHLDSLAERAKLSALLMMKLATGAVAL